MWRLQERNQLLAFHFSSKFARWLSNNLLSLTLKPPTCRMGFTPLAASSGAEILTNLRLAERFALAG